LRCQLGYIAVTQGLALETRPTLLTILSTSIYALIIPRSKIQLLRGQHPPSSMAFKELICFLALTVSLTSAQAVQPIAVPVASAPVGHPAVAVQRRADYVQR